MRTFGIAVVAGTPANVSGGIVSTEVAAISAST